MFPPEPGFAVAGALHQANGGFLILPAAALLKNELLYEQLKACLLVGAVHRAGAQPLLLSRRRGGALVPVDPARREGDARREPVALPRAARGRSRVFSALQGAGALRVHAAGRGGEADVPGVLVGPRARAQPAAPVARRRRRADLPRRAARREPVEGDELPRAGRRGRDRGVVPRSATRARRRRRGLHHGRDRRRAAPRQPLPGRAPRAAHERHHPHRHDRRHRRPGQRHQRAVGRAASPSVARAA
jgi:hypothetical protein